MTICGFGYRKKGQKSSRPVADQSSRTGSSDSRPDSSGTATSSKTSAACRDQESTHQPLSKLIDNRPALLKRLQNLKSVFGIQTNQDAEMVIWDIWAVHSIFFIYM